MSYLFPAEPPSETATLPALPTDQGELPPLPSGDGDAVGEVEPVVEEVETPAPPAKRQRTSRSSAKASSSNGGNTYKPIPRLLNLPPPGSPPSHLFPPPSPGSRKARGHDADEETAGADETETDGLPPLPTASPPPQEPTPAPAPAPAASTKPAKGKRTNANAQTRPTPPDALLPPPLHPPPPPGSSVNLYIGRALLANDNWPMKPHDIVGWIKHHHADQWDGDEGRCSAHRVRTYLARKGTDMYYEKLTQGCLTGWRIRQQHLWRFQDGGFQGRGVKQEDFPATQAIANAKILAEAQKHAEEQAAQAHATAAASASTVAAIQAAAAAAANANGHVIKPQMNRLQPQQQHQSSEIPALPGHEQGYDYNPLPVSSYSYNPPQQQQQQYAQAYPTYPPQYPQHQQQQQQQHQQYQQQYQQYPQQQQQQQQQQQHQQQHDQQHADGMLAIDPALMGELGRQ